MNKGNSGFLDFLQGHCTFFESSLNRVGWAESICDCASSVRPFMEEQASVNLSVNKRAEALFRKEGSENGQTSEPCGLCPSLTFRVGILLFSLAALVVVVPLMWCLSGPAHHHLEHSVVEITGCIGDLMRTMTNQPEPIMVEPNQIQHRVARAVKTKEKNCLSAKFPKLSMEKTPYGMLLRSVSSVQQTLMRLLCTSSGTVQKMFALFMLPTTDCHVKIKHARLLLFKIKLIKECHRRGDIHVM